MSKIANSVSIAIEEFEVRYSKADYSILVRMLQLFRDFLDAIHTDLMNATAGHAFLWIHDRMDVPQDALYQRCRVLRNYYQLLRPNENPFAKLGRERLRKPLCVRATDQVASNVRKTMKFVSERHTETGKSIWLRRNLALSLIAEHSLTPQEMEALTWTRKEYGEGGIKCDVLSRELRLSAGSRLLAAEYHRNISHNGLPTVGAVFAVRSEMFPIEVYRMGKAAGIAGTVRYEDVRNLNFIEGLEMNYCDVPVDREGTYKKILSFDIKRYSPGEVGKFVNQCHPISMEAALSHP